MYEYVNDAAVKPFRQYLTSKFEEVRNLLYDEGINSQFILVGSGKRKMITRDGNGPFDLDYNVKIINISDYYWKNPDVLKQKVMNVFNRVFRISVMSPAKNSTSVITSVMRDGINQFSVDLAIVTLDKKGYCQRLQCDKNYLTPHYVWNTIPDSKDLKKKEQFIIENGKWQEVRVRYLKFKNMRSQHSFCCYMQAVHEVYSQLQRNK